MRTAPVLFACSLAATISGAGLAGCGSTTRTPIDMPKGDMAIFFPGCDNNAIDSGESDVDCGGPCMLKCADGKMCNSKSDCASGVCIQGSCVNASICSDNAQNGDETDVDCGGSCPPCVAEKNCTKPSDCLSNMCNANKCGALKAGLMPGKVRSLGMNPVNVDVGDFDGDGKLDLISLSGSQDKAYIAFGMGDGITYSAPVLIDIPQAESPNTLAVYDFNGDKLSDILYTNGGQVVVLLNNTTMTGMKTATFAKEVKTLIGSDPGGPQLIDFDNDGKPELLHHDTSYDSGADGYNVYISAYQDGGKFKVLRKVFCDVDRPVSLLVADFDDDHFLDLAAILGKDVAINLQKPDMANTVNAFKGWKATTTGMVNATQIIAAEFDSPPDFRVDVVVLDRGNSAYGFMTGAGDGTLLKPTKVAVANGPAMMALTDFDLDDRADFATANYDNDTAGVLLGKGDHTFTQGPVATANGSPTYIKVKDMNGDRKPDLIVVNPGLDMVTILINKSS